MSEPLLRISCFIGVLAILSIWELIAPRRTLRMPKTKRWANNLGLAIVDTVLLRSLFPIAAVGFAQIVHQHSWGLFNRVGVPVWIAILLSVIALDFIIYLQHLLLHRIPILWRIHRVHHTDLDLDVTTGLRFHPIEIVLSMGLKIAAVILLGVPSVAVLIFEILLNGTALFNHSNLNLPYSLDQILRWVLVTPDMHRIHHSIITEETDSNFGFNLTWWDYLCGTYRAQPIKGHEAMTVGLDDWQTEQVEELLWMLANPFLKKIPLPKG